MFQDEYDKVEAPAIEQLKQLGWHFLPGEKLSPKAAGALHGALPERNSMRDVVLVQRLEAAIKRINPWISNENLRKVSRDLTHPNFAGLMEYNNAIYQTLVNYLSVEQDLGKGRNANERTQWKAKGGITLKQLQEQSLK